MEETETIVAAAIWHRGTVYSVPRPGRHHDVIRHMHDAYGFDRKTGDPFRHQGFVTSAGRFVSRYEAVAIANAAKQITNKTFPSNQLFSEDVW